jgi:hypothetical protein
VGKEQEVLEHHADAAVIGGHVSDIMASHHDPPGGGVLQSGNDPEQRGFARAARPKQGEEFVLPDVQVHSLDGLHRPELFANVLKRQ